MKCPLARKMVMGAGVKGTPNLNSVAGQLAGLDAGFAKRTAYGGRHPCGIGGVAVNADGVELARPREANRLSSRSLSV